MAPSEVIGGIESAVQDPNRVPEPIGLVTVAGAVAAVASVMGLCWLGPTLVGVVGDMMLVDPEFSDGQRASLQLVGMVGVVVSAIPHNKFVGLYGVPLLVAASLLQAEQVGYLRSLLRLFVVILFAVQLSFILW